MNRALGDVLDDERFIAKIHANIGQLAQLALEIATQVKARYRQVDTAPLLALLQDVTAPEPAMLDPAWFPG